MLGSCDYVPREFARGHFYDVSSSALFCYSAHAAVISPVGHSLLNRRIDRDRYHLPGGVWDEKSSQRILPLVSGFSAKKGPIPVSYSLGPLHPSVPWLEMESG